MFSYANFELALVIMMRDIKVQEKKGIIIVSRKKPKTYLDPPPSPCIKTRSATALSKGLWTVTKPKGPLSPPSELADSPPLLLPARNNPPRGKNPDEAVDTLRGLV
jgi:hypothetical protein